MRRVIFILITALNVFISNAQSGKIKNLNPIDFKKIIENNEGILLDVRTAYEFEDEHIKNAKQLNYYSWSFKDSILKLPKDKPIYVYCKSGYRSIRAAKILIENGYSNVYNLEKGIEDWKKSKHETVKHTTN